MPVLGHFQTLFRTDLLQMIYLVQGREPKIHTRSKGTSTYRPYIEYHPRPSPPPPLVCHLILIKRCLDDKSTCTGRTKSERSVKKASLILRLGPDTKKGTWIGDVAWFSRMGTHRKQKENEHRRARGAMGVWGHAPPEKKIFLRPRKCHFPCFQGQFT